MKTPKQIAETLLQLRQRMSHVVLAGELQAKIGPEGVQEALRRTWLCADMDFGNLAITGNLSVLSEMEDLANSECADCKKTECECDGAEKPKKDLKPWEKKPTDESRRICLAHGQRTLNEWSAPGSGQPDPAVRSATPAPAPPAPPAPAAPAPAAPVGEEPAVGEDVMVAENGQQYSATIRSREPDGTYTLTFGGTRPTTERRYRKEELTRS